MAHHPTHHLLKREQVQALRCLIVLVLVYVLIVAAARACGRSGPSSRPTDGHASTVPAGAP